MNRGQALLEALARRRWRMAIAISTITIMVYFGFILLIAFRKEAMAALLQPGLSVGIVLGAVVILVTWALTWFYVYWANRHIDALVARLREGDT